MFLVPQIITLRSARSQAAGTDCNGRDYLCLDDRLFQICIDFGDGKTQTVDDEAQSCPRGTFCSNTGRFECDSFVPPSTAAPQVVTPEEVPKDGKIVCTHKRVLVLMCIFFYV